MNLRTWGRVLGVLLAVMFVRGAFAETEGAQRTVEKVVQQIRSFGADGHGTPAQKAEAARQLDALLDLQGLAQRSLGPEWSKLSPPERKEFVGLVHQLFEKVAYPKAAKFFGDLQLQLKGTGKGDSGFVLAPRSATLINAQIDHPDQGMVEIDFAVFRDDGRWRIADVVLDDVSLGRDIRTQMQQILHDHGYAELKRRIEKKIREEGTP